MNESVATTKQVGVPGAGGGRADVYHTALVRAFLFQVLFALLASLML